MVGFFVAQLITGFWLLLVGFAPEMPSPEIRFTDTFTTLGSPFRAPALQIHFKMFAICLEKLQILNPIIVPHAV